MGLLSAGVKAAREAFEQQQKRALDLFGEGEDVYHWVSGRYLKGKLRRGFSPFTHVGTKDAARELFAQRELGSAQVPPVNTFNEIGATLPLRFNRNKEILDVEKDIGDHSALGVMWQVAPHLYGDRDSALSSPLVKRTLDSVTDAMSNEEVEETINQLAWGGYMARPTTGGKRAYLRKKLEEIDETASGALVKMEARDADMIGRRTLAHELEKFNIGALKYKNEAEDIGSTSYMIVQPHDIRSRHANYDRDEWLKRNANIMAALPVAVGAGGLLALSKREREAA